jgi:hypothetical protein
MQNQTLEFSIQHSAFSIQHSELRILRPRPYQIGNAERSHEPNQRLGLKAIPGRLEECRHAADRNHISDVEEAQEQHRAAIHQDGITGLDELPGTAGRPCHDQGQQRV